MDESWIDLRLQKERSRKAESHGGDDAEEVISGPSTASSTSTSSSIASLQKEGLESSGSTDERLGASFNTLLKRREGLSAAETEQSPEQASEANRQRRDTITKHKSSRKRPEEREDARQEHRKARSSAITSSYWSGFYAGISIGISTVLMGIACWRLNLRLRLFDI